MKRVFCAMTLVSLAGCGAFDSLASGASGPFSGGGTGLRGAQSEVEGISFRTRVSATTEDDRGFVTATRGAGRSVRAALEAGRLEAVKYCLSNFGGSEIVWTLGPDRELEQIALDESGALVLSGTCISR